MIKSRRQSGFSLTEMLIATGIMAIGLVMVATIFPVGVKLTSLSTERTIGAVVADEAFAKIQLYGLRSFVNWPSAELAGDNPNETYSTCDDFMYAVDSFMDPGADSVRGTWDDNYFTFFSPMQNWPEFRYPSTVVSAEQDRNYHWSALCRRVGPKDVQVTVFVTRKIGSGAGYRAWDSTIPDVAVSDWPKPVPVNVSYSDTQPKELTVQDDPAFPADESKYFFDDGYTIIDNLTGKIYRILEVDHTTGTLRLQNDWQWVGYPLTSQPANENRTLWVVPPATGSDRYPCVGVYQKIIRFDDIN